MTTCANCSHTLAPSDRFCPQCGRRISSSLIEQQGSTFMVPEAPRPSRLLESFSNVYLTIASILQGAVFTLLISYVALNYTQWKTPIPWILSVSTFLIIVLLWHHYIMVALNFAWIVSIEDALIHFGLGAAEAYIAFTIGDNPSRWFLASAIFSLVGFFAVFRTYVEANATVYRPQNKDGLEFLGPWPKLEPIMAVVAGGAMVILYLLNTGTPVRILHPGPVPSFILSLVALMEVLAYFAATTLQSNRVVRGGTKALLRLMEVSQN